MLRFFKSICLLADSSSPKDKHTFFAAHWIFGRCLGLVSFFAFLSYWLQADALIGPDGLNPWQADLQAIENLCHDQGKESRKWILRPTILWLDSIGNHHFIFLIGSVSALLLSIGILPFFTGFICYLSYLSLIVVGEPFLSFQWDVLLTETLFLSLFFLPQCGLHRFSKSNGFPRISRLLLVALLAKLMIESGVVKFTYFAPDGTNTWKDLTALNFHYWSQPLPHPLSPLIDSLPSWFDHISLFIMYAIEMILPLLFFLPGRWRRFALLGQVSLQLMILVSGNYGFFNFLTLCLCIPLIDDQMLPNRLTNRIISTESKSTPAVFYFRNICLLPVIFVFASSTYGHLLNDLRGNRVQKTESWKVPRWIDDLQNQTRILRCFNSYGLFRVMTTTRPEIIIEASKDGKTWHTCEFEWKPSHSNQKLKFTGPHMPRLDWQMWFEGLNFENYAKHTFSRFLYGRFLQIKMKNPQNSVFLDLKKVLGEKEFQALNQAPPQVQRQAIANYNQLIQSFLSRSNWFANLLVAIAENRPSVMDRLSASKPLKFKPSFLRVSLRHFSFSDKEDQIWEIEKIPNASYVLKIE